MSPYEVLGVPESAGPAEIRAAYLARARAVHPDRPGGSAAEMQRVNDAWALLSDPSRKAGYDLGARRARDRARSGRPRGRDRSGPSGDGAAAAQRAAQRRAAHERAAAQERLNRRRAGGTDDATGPASWRAMVPIGLLTGGGVSVLVGSAVGFGLLIAVGAACFVLAFLSFLLVPLAALSESRRADGPQ